MPVKYFPGRLVLQQRVLPIYRVAFFDLLAESCEGGMSLFAGTAHPSEGVTPASGLRNTQYAPAHNIHLFRGPFYLCYQRGLLDWLADWNPDALIVEANPRYLATASAVHWMHARGRKVIGWGLGAPPLSGPLSESTSCANSTRCSPTVSAARTSMRPSVFPARKYLSHTTPSPRVPRQRSMFNVQRSTLNLVFSS
jgi:hypothetical protein